MKVVKFKGGMGNQMFQYAFLRNLQEMHGCEEVLADFSYFNQCGTDKIRIPRIAQMNTVYQEVLPRDIKKICLLPHGGQPISARYRIMIGIEAKLNPRYFFEPDRAYRPIEELMGYTYYDGYWQSWRYLEPIKAKLKEEFLPKEKLSIKSRKYMEQFQSCNSVSVGIRRGDYVNDPKALSHHGGYDEKYYQKAIAMSKEQLVNPTFVFFSNDIEWVKKNMNSQTLDLKKEQIIYREKCDIVDDFEELYVMSSCRNAIITNSTFHFWGAWLMNNEEKIIISPKDWFKDNKPIDIIPDSWIKI